MPARLDAGSCLEFRRLHLTHHFCAGQGRWWAESRCQSRVKDISFELGSWPDAILFKRCQARVISALGAFGSPSWPLGCCCPLFLIWVGGHQPPSFSPRRCLFVTSKSLHGGFSARREPRQPRDGHQDCGVFNTPLGGFQMFNMRMCRFFEARTPHVGVGFMLVSL